MRKGLEIFESRLSALRKEKKLTQTDMGEVLGCSMRNYHRLEHGEINATATTLIALADYFDVTIDYLLGRTDER